MREKERQKEEMKVSNISPRGMSDKEKKEWQKAREAVSVGQCYSRTNNVLLL